MEYGVFIWEVNMSYIELIKSNHSIFEHAFIKDFYLYLSLLDILNTLKDFVKILNFTMFKGSKKMCSCHYTVLVGPTPGFDYENFFIPQHVNSMIGDTESLSKFRNNRYILFCKFEIFPLL